jgi:hypothetical protein
MMRKIQREKCLVSASGLRVRQTDGFSRAFGELDYYDIFNIDAYF